MLIKLVFYILLIAVLTVAAVWFSATPGQIVANWQDYEITTSTTSFVFATILAIICIGIIIPAILGLIAAPRKWWRKKQDTKYKRGMQLVTETLAAISSGDLAAAEILIKKVKKQLSNQPIIPLLQAQLAGAKKDQVLLQQSFQAMLEHSETKALGSKSLAEYHMRKGDVIPAIPHAEQALELEPKNTESIKTTLSLYIKSEQWERARSLILQAKKRKSFTKLDERSLLACIDYLQCEQAERAKDIPAAKAFIQRAYGLTPHRAHIYAKFIDLHNNDQDVLKAVQVVKKSWQQYYTDLLPGLLDDLLIERNQKRKLLKTLQHKAPEGRAEALRLLAEIAMKDQDEFEAHLWLEKYLAVVPGSFVLPPKPDKYKNISNTQEIHEILKLLSKRAAPKKWECVECGGLYDAWQATCKECNGINTINRQQ